MSYRCQICNKIVPNGVEANKKIAETREKVYSFFDEKQKRNRTTKGHEIVKEKLVCEKCQSK